LRLAADGEIPGLVPFTPTSRADVRVWLNQMPAPSPGGERVLWYQSAGNNRHGRPNLTIWRSISDGAFCFAYDDRTQFLVQADGSQVWCTWPAAASIADMALYLRGPVLGFVLRLRGTVCLHASAIAVDQSAIAILGAGGGGKSTTAAGFVKLGFKLLADDVAALDAESGNVRVLSGYPRLNLWPDAAEALYGSGKALPRLTPAEGINGWWDKRYVELDANRQFQQDPLPLAAVYVLGERIAGEPAPRVERMGAQDAFMALTDETYVNYALDESMRAKEFRTLGRLVRTTPVRCVTVQTGPMRPLDLCNTILADYRQLALELPELCA
jgi:hypothetical protein